LEGSDETGDLIRFMPIVGQYLKISLKVHFSAIPKDLSPVRFGNA